MIVGLSGYARTGKDTVADILVKQAGFERVAFADKLRECLYALDPVVWDGGYDYDSLAHVIDVYGWDGVKSSPFKDEVRRLLQRFGTEVGRNILGDNIWVDATFNALGDQTNYVITDCRFANEAHSIQELGGQVWRIQRPGVEPINDHISEIGLDNWNFDRYINNRGSISDLETDVLHGLDTASSR